MQSKITRIHLLKSMVESHADQDSCLVWPFSTGKTRYGVIRIPKGRNESIHRASYEMFKGRIPAGYCVCHTCDNPRCFNPKHLFTGTVGDNNRDAISKGRLNPTKNLPASTKGIPKKPRTDMAGAGNFFAKHSPETVRALRTAYENGEGSPSVLGKRLGIPKATAWKIAKRRSWRNL